MALDDDKTRTYVQLTSGTMVSHYRIIEKIGAGGMGEVYLAEDTELNRKVALKFLPPDLCRDADCRARFKREAQAAAKLDHPNIIQMYEVGEYQSRPFIAMQYVEGRSLKEYAAGKKFSVREVVELGIQIAEGLAAAHEAGIIHRDIKPSNILIDSHGRARIVDFGLATVRGADHLTKTGSTLGTLYYMSPEQTRGEEVDHRADIFSLGVVLYELIAGQLPFRGEHEPAIIYAIAYEEPEPLGRHKSGVPDEVQRIVGKMLAKAPPHRYQTAADLTADLKRLSTEEAPALSAKGRRDWWNRYVVSAAGAILLAMAAYWIATTYVFPPGEKSGATRKMLAVLPLENIGPAEQEYFADGLTDEITTKLGGITGLRVIARSSAVQYKKTTKTVAQIGKELGAGYLLQGTIRWEQMPDGSQHLRVNPQLIQVSDGSQVWSQSYEGALAGVFGVQADIATQVAQALGVALLSAEQRRIEKRPTNNIEAYEYSLRGDDYSRRGGMQKEVRIAIEMYKKAVELDPTFALVYASLSIQHSFMYWAYYDRTDERLNKAKEAVDKALELEPDLPGAHWALGAYYYFGSRDYARALEQYAIGQKSQPNNAELVAFVGYIQRRQGKFEQAVTNLKKAIELDPLSYDKAQEVEMTYRIMRKYADAMYYVDRAISMAPDRPRLYNDKVWLYLLSEGDTKKARKVLQEATGKADMSDLVPALVGLDVLDGDYQTALNRLVGPATFTDPDGVNDTISYYLTKARIFGLLNRPQLILACYDSARIFLEKKVQSRPGDSPFHSYLGIAYAGLGRTKEAIREGKRGVELLPVSQDALDGPINVQNLAEIYVMVGDYDSAIDQLEYLLSIPSWFISIVYLRIDTAWAPLRSNPRFQKLLEKYGT